MKFEELLNKSNISISDFARQVCSEGIVRMEQNPDPHHNSHHLQGLFIELYLLLQSEPSLRAEIKFDILLSAICWHDVWKGGHSQTHSFFVFLFRELWDAPGSYFAFKKWMSEPSITARIPENFSKEVGYCILMHSRITNYLPPLIEKRLFPLKSLEAQVLFDLDTLDSWSQRRIDNLETQYLNNSNASFDPRWIPIVKWWYFHHIQNASPLRFNLEYSQNEFLLRKEALINRCITFWKEREKYFDVSDPKIAKYFKVDQSKLTPEILQILQNDT